VCFSVYAVCALECEYISAYVCALQNVYECVSVFQRVRVCVRVLERICVYVSKSVSVRVRVCVFVFKSIYVYESKSVCVCVCVSLFIPHFLLLFPIAFFIPIFVSSNLANVYITSHHVPDDRID